MSRRLWPLLAAVALAASLAACGKKADVAPPENAQVPYTYPKQYPNPATVLTSPQDDETTPVRPAPPHAGSLTPFPLDRTTTTTYQSAPVQ